MPRRVAACALQTPLQPHTRCIVAGRRRGALTAEAPAALSACHREMAGRPIGRDRRCGAVCWQLRPLKTV
eukprot:366354-Chlamydomonas_euryale.AAC.4